jgi:hypothetical protein
MKVLISHPTGNANVRAIAKGLATKSILYQFYTTIAVFPSNIWYLLGRFKPLEDEILIQYCNHILNPTHGSKLVDY